MNQKQSEAEIRYWLIKMILSVMVQEGVLNKDDVEKVRKKAVRKLKPMVGSLE